MSIMYLTYYPWQSLVRVEDLCLWRRDGYLDGRLGPYGVDRSLKIDLIC